MEKIAIVAPSHLPVPSVKGGAVETLIQIFIDENEIERKSEITVFSFYDTEAEKKALNYKYTRFVWLNKSLAYKVNNFITRGLRKLFGKMLPYDEKIVLEEIQKGDFSKVVIESNTRYALSISNKIPQQKVFLHVHANLFKNKSDYLTRVAKQCGTILTVSKFIKNEIIRTTGVDAEKIKVLRNCSNPLIIYKDTEKAKETAFKHSFIKGIDEVFITYVGRIVPSKGITELFKALSMINELNFKLVLVGNTDSKFGRGKLKTSYYYELLNIDQELSKKVIFTGYLQNELLSSIHSVTDIAVIPSIEDEAAPLAIIEAMNSGIPIIASDSGGIPEYITSKYGIIVKRNSDFVTNLSTALKLLIVDKNKRNELGSAALLNAKNFSSKAFYKNFISFLGIQ